MIYYLRDKHSGTGLFSLIFQKKENKNRKKNAVSDIADMILGIIAAWSVVFFFFLSQLCGSIKGIAWSMVDLIRNPFKHIREHSLSLLI